MIIFASFTDDVYGRESFGGSYCVTSADVIYGLDFPFRPMIYHNDFESTV